MDRWTPQPMPLSGDPWTVVSDAVVSTTNNE